MNVLTVEYGRGDSKKRFTESLRDTGFAVLSNHPIPQELIKAVFEDWAAFFTTTVKHEYLFDVKTQEGYFPFKSENAKNYNIKDLKEFYHLYEWSKLPKGLTDKTWEFFKRMSALSNELLGWVQEETPADIRSRLSMPLTQMTEGSRETLLRPIHYPPIVGNEEVGAIRAAAHEDINLITLLPAATAPGLQVLDNAGTWHNVSCDPGTIAINAGDMLQMATEGYYRSTTHRVINPADSENAGKPRYSMPLFLHPRADVRLSSQYTAGSYLEERLREIGLIHQKPKPAPTDSATL